MPRRSIAFRTLQDRALHAFIHDPTIINRRTCYQALLHWLSVNPIYQAMWQIRNEAQQAYVLDQLWKAIRHKRLVFGIPIFELNAKGKKAELRHKKKRQPL